MSFLAVDLWWVVPGVVGAVCGPVGFVNFFILALFRAQLGYLQSCSTCLRYIFLFK